MNSPRTIVQRIPPLPPEQDDHFYGYGVMGLPFASRQVLAMRKMHSSIGPKYEWVWHRSPEGAWTMWSDVAPSQSCPRYWGSDLQRAIQAPIDISWPGPSRMTVKISNGQDLDWEVQLGSTLITRTLGAVGRTMPSTLWRRRAVLSAMGAMAGPSSARPWLPSRRVRPRRRRVPGMVLPTAQGPGDQSGAELDLPVEVLPVLIFTVIRDGPGQEMSIGAWIARCRSLPQYRGQDCDGATSDHIVHAPSGLRCQTDSYFGPIDECIFRMASTCPKAKGRPITP